MMPGIEIDRRRLRFAAALAAKASEEIFEGHVAHALHEKPHWIADGTAAAMKLDDARRPIGKLVRRTKLGRVHLPILDKNGQRTRAKSIARIVGGAGEL